jgi:hypothetical protein
LVAQTIESGSSLPIKSLNAELSFSLTFLGTTIWRAEMICLCRMAREIPFEEGTFPTIGSPLVIVGDIRGRFYDVQEPFVIAAAPPRTETGTFCIYEGVYTGLALKL